MAIVWFDVALTAALFGFGSIFFGHFEERTARWRRALKLALWLGLAMAIPAFLGSLWYYGLLALTFLAVLVVHFWWLPRHGIDPLTAEPKEKYYKLRGWTWPPKTS